MTEMMQMIESVGLNGEKGVELIVPAGLRRWFKKATDQVSCPGFNIRLISSVISPTILS